MDGTRKACKAIATRRTKGRIFILDVAHETRKSSEKWQSQKTAAGVSLASFGIRLLLFLQGHSFGNDAGAHYLTHPGNGTYN